MPPRSTAPAKIPAATILFGEPATFKLVISGGEPDVAMTKYKMSALARSMFARYDAEAEKLGDKGPDDRRIECGRGCSHCCYLLIGVAASEIVNIKEYLQQPDQKSRLEKVKARIRNAKRQVDEALKTDPKTVRVACPLLSETGECTVYPVRPVSCRAYVSFDLDACRRDRENPAEGVPIAQSRSRFDLVGQIGPQLAQYERGMGARSGLYELRQGLFIAFETARFEQRLMNGEDLLSKATLVV
jgi:Fe-S-cluster containining protein